MEKTEIKCRKGERAIIVRVDGMLTMVTFGDGEIVKLGEELERLSIDRGEIGVDAPEIVAFIISGSLSASPDDFWKQYNSIVDKNEHNCPHDPRQCWDGRCADCGAVVMR